MAECTARGENLLRLLVEQQDAERSVVDDPPEQAGDAHQKLFEIEDRSEFAADLAERFEHARVGAFLLEEARVFDGDGHMGAKHAQHHGIGFRVLIRRAAQHGERADDAPLVTERGNQLRSHARHHPDVPRIGLDIVHEQ